MNIAASLSDDAWAEFLYRIQELGANVTKELGRKPTHEEFFEAFSWALRNSALDLFCDLPPRAIECVSAKISESPRIRPGTIIGISASRGYYYPIIYLCTNAFGDAVGTFHGLWDTGLPGDWSFPPGQTVYAELKPAHDGRWTVLGFRPDLLPLFPSDPEIYHSKADNRTNPAIGEHGSAESPTGSLRPLSAKEAKQVGLHNGVYRQSLGEDEFIAFLRRQLGAKLQ